jgi:hypothetical protein
MTLLDDFTVVPALDESKYPIKVYLEEDDPSLEEFLAAEDSSFPDSDAALQSRASAVKRRQAELQERGDPADACHCQWMFQ